MTARQELALQQHPLSAAFPSMPEAEIEALAADIKKHGQREPGLLLDGMVLDGWHRYLACGLIDLDFRSEEFTGDDPVSFVKSKNWHRRHLTASQKAATEVALGAWHPSGRANPAAAAGLRTTAEMAKEAGVSPRTIEHAKAAHEAGLGKAVREGEVSAVRAAEIAKLPKAKRAKALKDPAPAREGKPKADVEKLHVRISALETQLNETKESLGEMRDLAASAKVFEDKDEFKEMQVLRLELRSCKRRRDELMRENDQLKTEVKRWRKKAGGK